MRNVSLMGKIDTINLKLLSVEIIAVASPGVVCVCEGNVPYWKPSPLVCSSLSALLCVTGLLCLSVISG